MWEQPIPKVWWKVVGYTGQDAEEMGFEGVCGYLGCVASVASWWHQFHAVCMCHGCHFLCFLIPHCWEHVSWGQCCPVSVGAGVCAHIILVSLRFFMGLMRMALLSIFTITMMYLLSQRDWDKVLRAMYIWVYTLLWHKKPRRVSYKCTFGMPDQGQALDVWRWYSADVNTEVATTPGVTTSLRKDTFNTTRYLYRN